MQENYSRLQIVNNFYITIEEQKVARYKTIPQQVNFEFTPENLDAITQIQTNHNSLSFDSELLTNLRYYSLWQSNNILSPGLTFTSYYRQGEQKIAVISSNILLQCQISQKIRHDFLVNLTLVEKIINAHYWSIEQIFQQLPLTYQKKSYLLPWILSLFITFAIVILSPHFLPSIFFLNATSSVIPLLITIMTILILTKLIFQYLVKKYLVKFILQQLLFGFFSYKTTRRKLGFTLLSYFG